MDRRIIAHVIDKLAPCCLGPGPLREGARIPQIGFGTLAVQPERFSPPTVLVQVSWSLDPAGPHP